HSPPSFSHYHPPYLSFFFLLPRPPPCSTLFPYTTLFRSLFHPAIILGTCFTQVIGDVRHAGDETNPLRVLDSKLENEQKLIAGIDRKSTRLNSSHDQISYAVFCLKKKRRLLNYNTTLTIL